MNETRIEMGPTVTIEKMLVTPEMAARWLKFNVKNRPLSSVVVKRHAEAMKKGLWKPNAAEPIAFAWNGTLTNGQHRLNAVIKSGCSVSMYILRGADPDDFSVIDTGKTRGASDIVALLGIGDANRVASAMKSYFALRNHYTVNEHYSDGPSSHRQGTPIFNQDYEREVLSDCEFWQKIGRFYDVYRKAAPYMPSSFSSGMYAYLVKERHVDDSKVRTFFDEVSGATLSSVIVLLRNRLIADQAKVFAAPLSASYKQKLIIKAWNLWRRGEHRTKLRVLEGEYVWFD